MDGAARGADRPPHAPSHAYTSRRTRRHVSPHVGSGPRERAPRAIVATHLPHVPAEQLELLPRLLEDARGGLAIPRIALRHRLQYDVHGLDRSRHRLIGEDGTLVVELDMHGSADAATARCGHGCRRVRRRPGGARARQHPPRRRRAVARASRRVSSCACCGTARACRRRRSPGPRPGSPVAHPTRSCGAACRRSARWAMEVLGLRVGMDVVRDEVNRRFRRLLRDAHPDHGGATRARARRGSPS